MDKKYLASEQHKQLADYIKNVHQRLRQESKKVGFEKAWATHCEEQSVLQEYATSMRNLATEHWSVNNQSADCRINWIQHHCLEYFFNTGLQRERELEVHKLSAYNCANGEEKLSPPQILPNTKLNLLDVGSCYNPFAKFPMFQVLAIDIAPACPDVKKCDFLNVEVVSNDSNQCSIDSTLHNKLPKESFDVVVFSLLLEYFPNSDLRFQCCMKAYNILKLEGLLFIITPDSKHATANAKIMKKWRLALATLGFWRIKYEKLTHLHCMAFRKSRSHSFPQEWLSRELKKCEIDLQNPSELMVIPQDFNSLVDDSNTTAQLHRSDSDDFAELFQELPTLDSI